MSLSRFCVDSSANTSKTFLSITLSSFYIDEFVEILNWWVCQDSKFMSLSRFYIDEFVEVLCRSLCRTFLSITLSNFPFDHFVELSFRSLCRTFLSITLSIFPFDHFVDRYCCVSSILETCTLSCRPFRWRDEKKFCFSQMSKFSVFSETRRKLSPPPTSGSRLSRCRGWSPTRGL
jgi:hypothetical protein